MILRKILLFTALAASIGINAANEELKEWVLANYTKREVMIPMRDGVKLFTSIYEPKDSALRAMGSMKRPILVERSPYTSSPYGEEFGSYLWRREAEYVRRGYILVFQDVRGKNHSEGDYEDVRPVLGDPLQNRKKGKQIDETTDTYDTVDWLIKHIRNNNGKVGFWGISNPGHLATMAGICCHPAVKAVAPEAPVTNWWIGDDMHHNGAFFLMDTYDFFPWFSHHDITKPFDHSRIQLRTVDAYTKYLEAGAIRNLTARIDSVPIWTSACEHPDYDEWWQQRDAIRYVRDVRSRQTNGPAVMVVGGQYDAEDCWGAINTYKAFLEADARKTDVSFVFGPWSHGGWRDAHCSSIGDIVFGDTISGESFARDIEYPFFAYYLDGEGEHPVPVRVFATGENRWKNLSQWPTTISDVPSSATYNLHADGCLSATAPSADEKPLRYTSDPKHPVPYQSKISDGRGITYLCSDQRFASYRPDVLTYQTQPLTDTLRIAGPIDADLSVSISTTDADFIVKVIDVLPDTFEYSKQDLCILAENKGIPVDSAAMSSEHLADMVGLPLMPGYQRLVRADVMRGRYRDSGSDPKPFVPGETTEVRFTLPDVCHTFLPGHRLMVQVQSSWYPLVDMNPQQFVNIYKCSDTDFVPSEITLHHSADHPSRIVLPVVK